MATELTGLTRFRQLAEQSNSNKKSIESESLFHAFFNCGVLDVGGEKPDGGSRSQMRAI